MSVHAAEIGGFDARLLLRVHLRNDVSTLALDEIDGVTVVSQEEKSVLLAFATVAALATFEQRLVSLADTGTATKKELLFAIEDFSRWTPENRMGKALLEQGFPERDSFLLDVELWPLENPQERQRILEVFISWARAQQIEVLDTLMQPSLILVRVSSSLVNAKLMLEYRDARTVDLPPRTSLGWDVLLADINQFPDVTAPSPNAPKVVVLDSGIAQGHPLLAPAIGDAQGFTLPGRSAADDSSAGHGTFVSGIALYGDVAASIRSGSFVPQLQLFSGRVFNEDGQDQTRFVEKAVEEAVRYFREAYQCRVFNLSYGDRNKVYDGKHVRGLAYTLDRLTRDLDVLFVVSTGNLLQDQLPENPTALYPDYLLTAESRLIDPAPALNAITVGGIAVLDQTNEAQRSEHVIEDVPIARIGQPSPFTRAGFSVGKAIKPDFVEDAGNLAYVPSRRSVRHQGAGYCFHKFRFCNRATISPGHGNQCGGTSHCSPCCPGGAPIPGQFDQFNQSYFGQPRAMARSQLWTSQCARQRSRA